MEGKKIVCFGDRIAVEPIEVTPEKVIKNGFASVKQKCELIHCKVVFGDFGGKILPDDEVWLVGQFITSPVAKEVFEIEGKKCVLVDLQYVRLVHNSNNPIDYRNFYIANAATPTPYGQNTTTDVSWGSRGNP